jgi:uncharacterized membrane protein YagU involved in acid resistance
MANRLLFLREEGRANMNKIIKDAVFGAIGGIAGTFVLNKTMEVLSGFQSNHDKWLERELIREQPTQALAGKIAEKGFGVELSKDAKTQWGTAISWGYGTVWGALYGIMRDEMPATSKGAGIPFGIGFGLFGSALLLPTFDLTPAATEFPVSSHLVGLASHCAYAATVEGVCTALEAAERAIGTEDISQKTNPELRQVS